jgi:hypothetical protein
MEPIGALYSTCRPNESLPLYRGPLTIQAGGMQSDGEGDVELRFLPSPTIHFHSVIPDWPPIGVGMGKTTVTLGARGGVLRGFISLAEAAEPLEGAPRRCVEGPPWAS